MPGEVKADEAVEVAPVEVTKELPTKETTSPDPETTETPEATEEEAKEEVRRRRVLVGSCVLMFRMQRSPRRTSRRR